MNGHAVMSTPNRSERQAPAQHCPRCGGNLFLSQDDELWEWHCLQCGRGYPLDQHALQATIWATQHRAA